MDRIDGNISSRNTYFPGFHIQDQERKEQKIKITVGDRNQPRPKLPTPEERQGYFNALSGKDGKAKVSLKRFEEIYFSVAGSNGVIDIRPKTTMVKMGESEADKPVKIGEEAGSSDLDSLGREHGIHFLRQFRPLGILTPGRFLKTLIQLDTEKQKTPLALTFEEASPEDPEEAGLFNGRLDFSMLTAYFTDDEDAAKKKAYLAPVVEERKKNGLPFLTPEEKDKLFMSRPSWPKELENLEARLAARRSDTEEGLHLEGWEEFDENDDGIVEILEFKKKRDQHDKNGDGDLKNDGTNQEFSEFSKKLNKKFKDKYKDGLSLLQSYEVFESYAQLVRGKDDTDLPRYGILCLKKEDYAEFPGLRGGADITEFFAVRTAEEPGKAKK